MNIRILLFLCCFCCCLPAQSSRVELVVWHGMAGHLGDEMKHLADAFNSSQNAYTIKLAYKGNYIETLTSFAAAFRAHQPPDLVQVFEVGTSSMLSPKGIIKPVAQLMREQGMTLPENEFIQAVRDFYSRDSALQAMPFNLSTPVVYYNKQMLAKVGYDSTNFPSTWEQMEVLAEKIKKAGMPCTYTSANPGWVLIEAFSAIHGLPMTQAHPTRAVYDTPQMRQHFERLKRWEDLHYFHFGGRVDDATFFFTSGQCALFSQSSGSYKSLTQMVSFDVGVAPIPLDTEVSTVRHTNIAGGAALWVVNGKPPEHYKGIAQFLVFITKPEIQRHWHNQTGYLPLIFKGVYADTTSSIDHPTLLLAKKELVDNFHGTPFSFSGPQNQIRNINDEALESMFSGLMTPKEALHDAVVRANHILVRFERNTKGPGHF